MPRDTAQRGGAVPGGQELLQRIINLEKALGIQGANPQAGFSVRDVNGFQRVRVGFLPNGDYGVWLGDTLGNAQELHPFVSSQVGTQQSTTSTTPVDLATPGPTVTATVGASGSVLVIASAFLSTAVGDRAKAYLFIDGADIGGQYSPFVEAGSAAAAVSVLGTYSQIGIFSVAPNMSHTFELKYSSASGGTAIFATRDLIVQPQ